MSYENDNRVVLTLDAGGTNFVFSAVKGNKEIINPVKLPSRGDNLNLCLNNIKAGFHKVINSMQENPVAISFAFPGPADYPNGIIADLYNLPGFKGGVALGPMLEEIFKVPVFINNDGNLFVLGEAVAGLLPWVNNLMSKSDHPKYFKNLFGITLGTGFGGGIVIDGDMLSGDNSAAGEIWIMRHKLDKDNYAEEGVSIRAVKRFYQEFSGISPDITPEPREIYDIAKGNKPGTKEAAVKAFAKMGEIAGDAIANAITLIDGLVVIGGGLAGAADFFLPEIVAELNCKIGGKQRLEVKAFNLEDKKQLTDFVKGKYGKILIPGSSKTITYDPLARIGVGISRLGTEKAVSIGAYVFALKELDKQKK